jgi:hypothetical protein
MRSIIVPLELTVRLRADEQMLWDAIGCVVDILCGSLFD